MASRNPPVTPPVISKKAARKAPPKKTGKFVVDTAGIVNIAGEVFVLNTNLKKFYDLSGSYDQALKGDEAFDEFFLSVFDTMPSITYTDEQTKQKVQIDISNPDFKFKIKQRAISIYLKLFGYSMLPPHQPPVKIPCDPLDLQILLQSLQYRRDLLKDQITAYNEVSTSNMKARYLRDHMIFLNNIIENEIPQKVKCEDIDALISGTKTTSFGNLNDANIKRLLSIFAYLIAQGRNPLEFFESKLPEPLQALTSIGLKSAPNLEQYLSQIAREGKNVNDYVSTSFTPTMRKMRDIIYGEDCENYLKLLEDSLNLPDLSNLSLKDRIDTLKSAIQKERENLTNELTKANQEIKETQDFSLAAIEQLQKENELKGSVTGLTKSVVLTDIDYRRMAKYYSNFNSIYNTIESILDNNGLLDSTNPPISFGEFYINLIFGDFNNILNIQQNYYDELLDLLKFDMQLDIQINAKVDILKNRKRVYTYEKIIFQKIAQNYQYKTSKELEIFKFYVEKNDKFLKELQLIDYTKYQQLPKMFQDLDTNYKNTKKNIYDNFKNIIDKYNSSSKNVLETIYKYYILNPIPTELSAVGATNYFKSTQISTTYPNYRSVFNFNLENFPGYFKDKSTTVVKPPPIALDPFDPIKPLPSNNNLFDSMNTQFNEYIYTTNTQARNPQLLNLLAENLRNIYEEKNDTIPVDIYSATARTEEKEKAWNELFESLIKIHDVITVTWLNRYSTIFLKTANSFYKKFLFTEQKIINLLEDYNNGTIDLTKITDTEKQKYYVFILALQNRMECEKEIITICTKAVEGFSKNLKPYKPQFGGASQKHNNELPILSPKIVKRMIRQMKNNVLSGEVIDEEDNLESLMEIYGEQTVDSTLGICSLSMLFLLFEVNLIKQNMNELRDAIYMPLQGLQKDKAYEFLQDFFSSFKDLDHSNELTFQLKRETLDISKDASLQAKKILHSMFSIENATTQYANEFIVFLQVVRTVLEENSPILEELGCLIPT
jgi:hypothetical protein